MCTTIDFRRYAACVPLLILFSFLQTHKAKAQTCISPKNSSHTSPSYRPTKQSKSTDMQSCISPKNSSGITKFKEVIRCSFKPLRCLRASAWNNLVEPHSWVGARPEAAFPAFTASAGLGLKPTVLQQLYQELGNVTQMQQARRRRLLCSVPVILCV